MRDDVQSPTSPISPVAPFPPLPSPAYHSRAPEFYGFVAWTSTIILFIIYILWAVLPDEWIVWLGIEWYPNREWAILVPAWSVMVVLLTYYAYFALAIRATPAFSEMSTVTDSLAHFPATSEPNLYREFALNDMVPELYDVPIGLVNRVLYSRKKIEKR